MARTYRPWAPDQAFLLPPAPRDWLPEDHLVFFILDTVRQLDLSEINTGDADKDPRGEKAYDPAMMTALLLFGNCTGVRSSRKLEVATRESVPFRILTGGQHPDHVRISEFRRRNLEAVDGLFRQVLRLCLREGLIGMNHVAIDGTKIQANASKHKAMSYERLKKAEEELDRQISEYLRQAEEEDQREDALYGKDGTYPGVPEALRDKQKVKAKLAQIRAELEAEAAQGHAKHQEELAKRSDQPGAPRRTSADWASKRSKERAESAARRAKERATAAGLPPVSEDVTTGTLPLNLAPSDRDGNPTAKAQRNFTDPDSRIMVTGGGYVQAYNGQIAVDQDAQVIVACGLSNQGPDQQYLIPMADRLVATGLVPKHLSADAGYFSESGIRHCEALAVDTLIPPDRSPHRSRPRGKPAPPTELRERMREKLATPEARAIYAKRKVLPEPVFGQIKERQGGRRLLLRGLSKVKAEWTMLCLAHNLLKLAKATRER